MPSSSEDSWRGPVSVAGSESWGGRAVLSVSLSLTIRSTLGDVKMWAPACLRKRVCVFARVQACVHACTIVCVCAPVYMWAETGHEQAQRPPGAQALGSREGASGSQPHAHPDTQECSHRALLAPHPEMAGLSSRPDLRPGEHPPSLWAVGWRTDTFGCPLGVRAACRQGGEGHGLLSLLQ